MPTIKLFRVSGYCCATAIQRLLIRSTTHAPDQPTCRPRLLHWTFDLAAPGHGQCGKGMTDFHGLSRAPANAQVELAQRKFTSACSRSSSCQLGQITCAFRLYPPPRQYQSWFSRPLLSSFSRSATKTRWTICKSLLESPSERALIQGACKRMTASNVCFPRSVATTSCARR